MAKKKWTSDHIHWSNSYWQQPIFTQLQQLYAFNFVQFPKVEQLSQWIVQSRSKLADANYSFIKQNEETLAEGLGYETHIYQHHQIPTREFSWHDFFNACIWGAFPRSKQALNHQHVQQIAEFGSEKRSRKRDILTQFDECGIVLAYRNEQDKQNLQAHLWIQAFWHDRQNWHQQIKPFIFGHAIYEMCLQPFIGLTAKALFVKVDEDFFTQSLEQQMVFIDTYLSQQMIQQDIFADKRALSPLPVLGIPGWCEDNQHLSYYQNTQYFRPKRVAK